MRADKTLINETLVGMTLTGAQRRSPCLVEFSGRDLGRPYFVDAARKTIGRDPRADIRVDEPKVSRIHCEVAVEHGQLWIRDLKCANGIFVNNFRINEAGSPLRWRQSYLLYDWTLRQGHKEFVYGGPCPRLSHRETTSRDFARSIRGGGFAAINRIYFTRHPNTAEAMTEFWH